MDDSDYNNDTVEEEQASTGWQSCLNFLIILLICATCPLSLPLLAACWCCQNFAMMGQMCLGDGMGEGTETALI